MSDQTWTHTQQECGFYSNSVWLQVTVLKLVEMEDGELKATVIYTYFLIGC